MKQNDQKLPLPTDEEISTARIMWSVNPKNMITAEEYIFLLSRVGDYETVDKTLMSIVKDRKGNKSVANLTITILEHYFKDSGAETRELVTDNFLSAYKSGYKDVFTAGHFSKEFVKYVTARVN